MEMCYLLTTQGVMTFTEVMDEPLSLTYRMFRTMADHKRSEHERAQQRNDAT